jgi:pyruvate formate lyase activating enzyme
VPGVTDDEVSLTKLREFIGSLSNVEKIELLPFHKMGEYKWKELGMDYQLYDTPPAVGADVGRAKKLLGLS